jgi:SAM-dependent methyltransferase
MWMPVLVLMLALFSGCQMLQGAGPAFSVASEEVGRQSSAGSDSASLSEEATQEPEGEQPSAGLGAGDLLEKTEPARTPDVVYVPTPPDVVDMMLHLARVTKDDVLYDLGCGDGRIVVAAAKKYGCKAVGFDIDPERVEESLENVRKNKVRRLVTIKQEDIFTLDLRPASVITLYLLPRLNVKLIPQLEKLEPGCRIVSHDFDMKGVKPDAVLTMDSKESGAEHTVYLWTTPLNKEDDDDDDDEALPWVE